jgi:hypothetical protein
MYNREGEKMMQVSKKKFFIYSFIFIVVISSIWIYTNVNSIKTERINLENNLARMGILYQEGKIDAIDFSLVATFSWDRLYIFNPYTSCERINEALGTYWLSCKLSAIEYSDSIILLVFTNRGKVVQYLDFYGIRGCSLSKSANEKGYLQNEAVFAATEGDGYCYPVK